MGSGIVNLTGDLKALKKLNFSGHVALEYEVQTDNPIPGMAECFGFIPGVMAAIG